MSSGCCAGARSAVGRGLSAAPTALGTTRATSGATTVFGSWRPPSTSELWLLWPLNLWHLWGRGLGRGLPPRQPRRRRGQSWSLWITEALNSLKALRRARCSVAFSGISVSVVRWGLQSFDFIHCDAPLSDSSQERCSGTSPHPLRWGDFSQVTFKWLGAVCRSHAGDLRRR